MIFKKLSVKQIALMGVLVGLYVVFDKVLAFETTFMKVSFTFIPFGLFGMLFGPFWAGIGCMLGDIASMIIMPKASFFIGFTLNSFVLGIIYSLCFYQKKITWKRVITATMLHVVIINLLMTPFWLKLMYHVPFWSLMPARLLKNLIFAPIQIFVSYYVFNKLLNNQKLKNI